MFAVVKTGGLQYRVTEDQVLEVGKIAGEVGQIVQLGEVLMLGGEQAQIGTPTVAGASVAAEILEQRRGPKIIAFKKRRRKNSRRKRGHRQEFTLLRITEILTDGKAPTKTASPKRAPKPKASAAEGEAAPAAETAKKPKTAAKKPATRAKAAAKGEK